MGIDCLSLLLLATAGATGAAAGSVAWLLVRLAGFFALAAVVHLFVVDRLFARLPASDRAEGTFLAFGALLAFFGAAAEFAELHAAFGGFVAGIVASHGQREPADHERGVSLVTFGVFAPVFFAAVGIRLDLETIAAVHPLLVIVPVVGITTKIAGGYLGNRLAGGPHGESTIVGVGMVPRTGVELVIVSVALTRGVFDQRVYAAFVVLVVVSVLVTPLLLERLPADRSTGG